MSEDTPVNTTTDADLDVRLETLQGDVRDALLTHVRDMTDPWGKMSEQQQGDKIYAIENMAERLVRRTAHLMASRGFDHVTITVGKFTVEGSKLKGNFESLRTTAHIEALADHQDVPLTLVLTDPQDFMGSDTDAKPDPDEPELELEDENGEPAPADGDGTDDEVTQAAVDQEDTGDAMPDIPPAMDRRSKKASATA